MFDIINNAKKADLRGGISRQFTQLKMIHHEINKFNPIYWLFLGMVSNRAAIF